MAKIKDIIQFDEEIYHINDNLENKGFKYEQHILQNVISPELAANPLNDISYRQIERLIEYLINSVRIIKLTYAYMFPKNSKLIN